jgi:hypothetical protein
MTPRRRSDIGVGLGAVEVPYDQSGGEQMPGMSVPEPGGTMKKMQFEFTDPAAAQAQAQPQIPQGAGIPPAGAQQAPVMPAGAQGQEQPQGQSLGLLGDLAPQMGMQQGMPQGPDSSMMSDDQLAGLVQDDPNELMGQQMSDQAFQDPQVQQQLMEAARRRLMGGGY